MSTRFAVLAALSLLASCSSVRDRRYTGAGPSCGGGETRATLVRLGDQAVLTPTDGSIALRGTIAPSGLVTLTWSAAPPRGTPKPGAKPPATQVATGLVTPDDARLHFLAAGCMADLVLTRPGG